MDVVSVNDFDRDAIMSICKAADHWRDVVLQRGASELLRGRVLANVFYEPSSRTACSFHAAMLRLGGSVVPVTADSSSVKKGETLEDTMRTMEAYCDAIVLRHPEVGAAARAAACTSVPLLNAGDGVGEHPSQALLDVYTILSEAARIDQLTITMVGDLKHGRTVHSLVKVLALFDVRINLVSPDSLRMPEHIVQQVQAKCTVQQLRELNDVISTSDVLYVTRVQRERFASAADYDAVKHCFRVTPQLLANAKSSLVLMHPLPRVSEIDPACDSDPRAAYFRQMRNGMYIRMALLQKCLEPDFVYP